jgi:hypothetical protein
MRNTHRQEPARQFAIVGWRPRRPCITARIVNTDASERPMGMQGCKSMMGGGIEVFRSTIVKAKTDRIMAGRGLHTMARKLVDAANGRGYRAAKKQYQKKAPTTTTPRTSP